MITLILDIVFYIVAGVLILIHLLPMIRHQHWIFRASDFGRIQLFALQFVVLLFGLIFIQDKVNVFWLFEVILAVLAFHNAWILFPYTPFYRTKKVEIVEKHSAELTILSSNVYQFNNEYDRLINLIVKTDPDIILTMETNKDWEEALADIEKLVSAIAYIVIVQIIMSLKFFAHLLRNLPGVHL